MKTNACFCGCGRIVIQQRADVRGNWTQRKYATKECKVAALSAYAKRHRTRPGISAGPNPLIPHLDVFLYEHLPPTEG